MKIKLHIVNAEIPPRKAQPTTATNQPKPKPQTDKKK